MRDRTGGMVIGLLLVLVLFPAVAEEPFEELYGPVSEVEKWTYEVEEKFGDPIEVWGGHTLNIYNANVNPLETIHYTEAGTVEKRYVREFEDEGRISSIRVFGFGGYVEETMKMWYRGEVQVSRTYNTQGDIVSAHETEFTENGNVSQMTLYDTETENISSIVRYVYATTGNPASMKMYNDEGELASEWVYTYPEDGMDVISDLSLYLLGVEILSTRYGIEINRVDEYGNWTEKHRYEWKERFGQEEWVLTNIYRRDITYR